MKRLPPPTIASLPSAFFSFLLHGGAVIATLLAMPQAEPLEAMTKYTIVPIDLVEMSDTTDLIEIAQAVEVADKELPDATESDAAPAPAPPPAEEDAVSFDKPKDLPKQEPKKETPKAAPAPAKSFNSELDDILNAAKEEKAKPSKNNASAAPASAAKQAPQMGAGERRQMKATILDIIATQLVAHGCWADHSDMADAKRLRATFRFSFAPNGTFAIKPTLIRPSRPMNDPPLNTYIVHAERALNECNKNGWKIPADYFRLPPNDQVIEFEFLTSLGANQ